MKAKNIKAEQHVESKIRFYKHLSIYIIVNILLLAINYFTSPNLVVLLGKYNLGNFCSTPNLCYFIP